MAGPTEPPGESVIYGESLTFGRIFSVLMVLVFVGVSIEMVIMIATGGPPALMIILGAIAVTVAIVFVLFRRLDFEITETEVRFGFGLLRKVFPRSRIISCEPYELRFRNYLGYGIRVGFDKTMAYNTRMGRGVKIVVEGCRKPYVVSLDNADEVCSILSTAENGGWRPNCP